MKTSIEYWNNEAGNYDKKINRSGKAYLEIYKYLTQETDITMKILDIGTGTGEIPICLCENVRSIEAIDTSSAMIQIARNKVQAMGINNINFSVVDKTVTSFENGSFDLIIISNLLHIIDNPLSVVEEARRLLKPDGKIIIISYLHDENILSRLISYFLQKKGHPVKTKFSTKSFCKFIEESKLCMKYKVKIKNVMPLIFTVIQPL